MTLSRLLVEHWDPNLSRINFVLELEWPESSRARPHPLKGPFGPHPFEGPFGPKNIAELSGDLPL